MKPNRFGIAGLLPFLLGSAVAGTTGPGIRAANAVAGPIQARSGGTLSAERYRQVFGPAHPFRVPGLAGSRPGARKGFQHAGFVFELLDPEPEGWFDSWFDEDDLFLEESAGGYCLRNPRRTPGWIRVTVLPR